MMLNIIKKLLSRKSQPVVDGRPAGYGTDTEFCAEVVQIAKVEKHPNADKLDIIHFNMVTGPAAYQCIASRGQFNVGDLAGYFSVDSLVPTSHPAFAFLKERTDGQSKEIYRLRAARLRGMFSQGLLVTLPTAHNLGDYLGDEYQVTYHSPPIRLQNSDGTVSSVKARTQPFPVYSVDSLKKLPNLFADGEPVNITEKIHGANMRFGWVRRRVFGIPLSWRFRVGSHRAMKDEKTGGGFYKSDVWNEVAKEYDLANRTRTLKGYTFFGEVYGYSRTGERIQDLVYNSTPESGPRLAIFDIQAKSAWLSVEEREEILAKTQLPGVPVLFRSVDDTGPNPVFAEIAEGMSVLNPKQIREGVVVESMKAPRRKAKYVSEKYLLRKDA